jgi:hypothetical protein
MTESDPRIEGFIRAISAYFGIEISELEALWGREGAGSEDKTQPLSSPDAR